VAATEAADAVVPLFVVDDAIRATRHTCPNRQGFLAESLRDLDASLRDRGGRLVVRRGRFVEEVLRTATEAGATSIHLADDVSGFARRRLDRLVEGAADRVEVVRHPGVTVVPPGEIGPSGGGEFKVFTPYHRRWLAEPWRPTLAAPRRVTVPDGVDGDDRALDRALPGGRSADVVPGGETAGLERLRRWARHGLEQYGARHDDLPGDATSRISAYLHFGCLSPTEVATRLRDRQGAAPFARQLCWRDFYHQVLAARPEAAHEDYRATGRRWAHDDDAFEAWREGRTGYPLIDAGMRQLRREGYMHNRARLVVASFLTKDLAIDWRRGADHFMDLLVDGDVANNQLNWQWTAGTGTDTNPHRIFNPVVQSQRFDPQGAYIRRYVVELAELDGDVHSPAADARRQVGYPEPIVDHHEAIASYRAAIGGDR
jgi:deoxyribodipyrimidine photo-lyase